MGEGEADDESEPRSWFRPGVAARAANPELRRKLKERIREREERREREEDDAG